MTPEQLVFYGTVLTAAGGIISVMVDRWAAANSQTRTTADTALKIAQEMMNDLRGQVESLTRQVDDLVARAESAEASRDAAEARIARLEEQIRSVGLTPTNGRGIPGRKSH